MNKSKEQRGITLVALIITVLILLILAGVAISAVKDDDIIGYANNAAESFENKSKLEEQQLNELWNIVGTNRIPNINPDGGSTDEDTPVEEQPEIDTNVTLLDGYEATLRVSGAISNSKALTLEGSTSAVGATFVTDQRNGISINTKCKDNTTNEIKSYYYKLTNNSESPIYIKVGSTTGTTWTTISPGKTKVINFEDGISYLASVGTEYFKVTVSHDITLLGGVSLKTSLNTLSENCIGLESRELVKGETLKIQNTTGFDLKIKVGNKETKTLKNYSEISLESTSENVKIVTQCSTLRIGMIASGTSTTYAFYVRANDELGYNVSSDGDSTAAVLGYGRTSCIRIPTGTYYISSTEKSNVALIGYEEDGTTVKEGEYFIIDESYKQVATEVTLGVNIYYFGGNGIY